MPEALKHAYNQKYLQQVADEISRHCQGFDKAGFLALVFDDEWQGDYIHTKQPHTDLFILCFFQSKRISLAKRC
ncbi:MAG: hypothetical protein K6L74_13805 [Neptuniibacter sp.]